MGVLQKEGSVHLNTWVARRIVLLFVSFPLRILVGSRSAYKIYYFSLANCSASAEFVSRTAISVGILNLDFFSLLYKNLIYCLWATRLQNFASHLMKYLFQFYKIKLKSVQNLLYYNKAGIQIYFLPFKVHQQQPTRT